MNILSVLPIALVLVALPAQATDRFSEVTPGVLYRGHTPTSAAELSALVKATGIRTVIDLDQGWKPTGFTLEKERTWCVANDVKFLNDALSNLLKPSPKRIREIVADIVAAEKPVFVHCLHGEDRTGLVIGAYRMLVEGWSFDRACAEMIAHGHSPGGWLGSWGAVLKELESKP